MVLAFALLMGPSLTEASDLFKGDPLWERLQGIAAAQKGEHEKAIEHFTNAIEAGAYADNLLAPVFLNRSSSYFALGEYGKSIADANRVIAIEPANAIAHALRATAFRDSGETAKALEDFKLAYELGYRDDWVREFLIANGVRVEE